ncbi:hypothetical protein N431DRAFT_394184 [Stipitochalara longipes BDJ]|nr:hypothetical protein N431DRAFT_394184 [Stipitochalara longipes BDJ]
MDRSSLSKIDIDRHEFFDTPRFVDHRSREAEFFNTLIECHIPSQVTRWDCYEHIGWVFELENVVLDVENTAIDTVVVRVTSSSMPRVYIDPLRLELRQLVSLALAGPGDILDFAVTLLQVVETAVIHIHEWKNRKQAFLGSEQPKGWDMSKASEKDIFDNPVGLNLDSVEDTAFHLLGKTVKELCESLEDDEFRVLHVENVLRTDLVRRFEKKQIEMLDSFMKCSYQQLRPCVAQQIIPYGSSMDNRNDLARELCRPRATYHGTSRWKVSSIVRWGFGLPGQKIGDREIGIAYGSSFGRGIYTSPEAEYALLYSEWSEERNTYGKIRSLYLPGLRLIICAVLMGRPLQVTREATRQTAEIADKTANSHVSPNLLEYVVFDTAQIIPCYVVHLDFGLESAREWLKWAPADKAAYRKKTHPKRFNDHLFPGEIEALKQAKKAAASKWFPYGYGPATGTSFVIEEIGAVSDDEENYGEYQGQRQEVSDEVRAWEEETAKAGSWFDEYQNARKEEARTKRARDDDDDN